MKLYVDSRSTYYATDKYLKNLIPIEINTLDDYLKTTLDIMPLFGIDVLVPGRFDEIESLSPAMIIDPSRTDIIDLPFLKDLNHSEIMTDVFTARDFGMDFEDFLDECFDICTHRITTSDPADAPFHDDNGNPYDSLILYDIAFNDQSPSLGILCTIVDDTVTYIEVHRYKELLKF